MMMPAALLAAAAWIKSTISPSWLDWRNSTASLWRRAAIGLRLARAEEIEVGAVEDVDGFRHGRSCRRDRGSVPLYRDLARKGEAEARERPPIGRRARRLACAPARALAFHTTCGGVAGDRRSGDRLSRSACRSACC